MTTALNSTIKNKFDPWLSAINQFFWSQDLTIEDESATFFCFKPFPRQIKQSEISDWVNLQEKSLSPFTEGDVFRFISARGAHFWFSANELKGVPETAAQRKLADGEHIVKGASTTYQQTWENGTLIKCTPSRKEAQQELIIDKRTPWAVKRQLDLYLKKPATYLYFCGLILLLSCLWWGTGKTISTWQHAQATQQAEALSASLGDKLTQQATIRRTLQSLSSLKQWKSEYGSFPESFSLVASSIMKQGDFVINMATWQDKRMELEFTSANVEITDLVSDLESLSALTSINIRPHDAQDTWVIEVQFR